MSHSALDHERYVLAATYHSYNIAYSTAKTLEKDTGSKPILAASKNGEINLYVRESDLQGRLKLLLGKNIERKTLGELTILTEDSFSLAA